MGYVHAAVNAVGLGVMGWSLGARRSGNRSTGRLLALGAIAVMGAGGWLGGHLTYTKGSRVGRG